MKATEHFIYQSCEEADKKIFFVKELTVQFPTFNFTDTATQNATATASVFTSTKTSQLNILSRAATPSASAINSNQLVTTSVPVQFPTFNLTDTVQIATPTASAFTSSKTSQTLVNLSSLSSAVTLSTSALGSARFPPSPIPIDSEAQNVITAAHAFTSPEISQTVVNLKNLSQSLTSSTSVINSTSKPLPSSTTKVVISSSIFQPQPSTTQRPLTSTEVSAVPFRLVFRWRDIKFDLRFLNTSSSQHKTFVSFTESQLISNLAPYVKAVKLIFIRPGSVEVTAVLTIGKNEDITKLEQELENRNRSGLLGNNSWIALFWGSEDFSCLPPETTIQNLPSLINKEGPVAILRSKDFIVQGSVTKAMCNSSNTLLFQWSLSRYKVNDSGETVIVWTILLDTKTTEWNLQKRHLGYGKYFVDFRAAFASNPYLIGSARGFFKIVQSPLRAEISGGNSVTRGKGSIITLDGASSQDPDTAPGDITSMEFTWLCKERQESFPTGPIESIPVVSHSSDNETGGCFGTGIGKLSSNLAVVNLTTSAMDVGKSYDVKLIVQKDGRQDDFEQQIEIVSGNPPEITISCVINCEETVSVSTRLALQTSCAGCACETARYKWLLISLDPLGNETSEVLTPDMTLTGLNLPGIIIKENELAGNLTYRLKVFATQDVGPEGIAAYQFTMNAPPVGGNCTFKPLRGRALNTSFDFQCSDWQDRDKPLTYQFAYKTGRGLYTVVSFGHVAQARTVLPQGRKNEDFVIEFNITIKDSLSAETASCLTLRFLVEPLSAGEDLSGLAVGNNSQLNQFVQLGDVKKATQLANAVLQTVQQSETIKTNERIEIKSSIVKEVSTVEVGNLQSLTQVTSVIGRATLEPEQVTVETQDLALQTLSSLTSLLRDKTKEDYAAESTLVERGGENLVLSLGNVLNSAAQKASVIGKTNLSTVERTKSQNVTKDIEKLLDDVGTTLLSRMVVDQEPHRVKTSSLSMMLNRNSPRSLQKTREFIQDGVGFRLPFTAITDDKAKNTKFVDSVVTTSAFNPFTSDPSSALVNSIVLRLVLKDDNGDILKVENSKEDVELNIRLNQIQEQNEPKEPFFAKPSEKGKMNYHKIDLPYADGNAVRLRIQPTGSVVFDVFVSYNQRPTVTKYDAKRKLPDEACRLISQEHCNDTAYDFLLVDSVLRKPGSYFIGILYEQSQQKPERRKRRSCFGKGRQKRSCVEFKDPPQPENITVIPVYNPKTDANYSMNVKQEECLFWDSVKEQWLSRGCKVGLNSTSTSLQCLCNHLTSFGGGVLVMPNKLDFDVVFTELTRIHETGNVAVLCTIIAALLVYFLVCIFARKADKKDCAQTGLPVHLNSSIEEGFQYELTIVTGVWKNSGTDANVAMVIHGSEADSQCILLNRNMIESRRVLARGNEDLFVIHLPVSLGEIQFVHIWHDNSGKHPSWFFSHMLIKDVQTGRTLTFHGNTWFALEKGDGKIDRLLTPISLEEEKSFKYSLNSRSSSSFTEGHMWLSVVTKPPKSKFTRVQRTTCCLCLLMSAMLVNALFYRNDDVADPTIQIGPLKFSWRQVVVGLESALIVTPVNLLIVAIFRNSAENRSNKITPSALKNKSASVHSRIQAFSCWGEAKEREREKEETESNLSDHATLSGRTLQRIRALPKKDFLFPYYFIYIAWFLSFVTVISSATFTFFFSLQWGKDISNEWLSSMLVSFTEDLFVIQPIKIVIIVLITAYFFGSKSDVKERGDQVKSEHASSTNATTDSALSSIEIKTLPEDEIELASEYRLKEAKMFSFVKELCLYMLFLTLLTVVCYGNRSYHGYLVTRNLEDTFNKFPRAKDPRFYWKWLKGQFVDGIYANEWYNGKNATKQEYINNKNSILLGMPRLRQLRVKKDSCIVPELARDSVKHCNDYYSLGEEDKTRYHLPGWKPFEGSKDWANFSGLCPAPWNYVLQDQLHNSPSWGFFDVYSGGGFVADLGYNRSTAAKVIDNLHEYSWIDRQTRAVVLEFVIYNPNTGYLSISTFYYEILPFGYGHPFVIIDTFPLTSTQTGFYQFYLICQLLFIILALLFVIREVYNIYKMRCSYFRDAWNWVELLQILFSFLVVVFFVIKSKLVLNSALKVRENPFVPVSFRDAVVWNYAENLVLAIAVFIVTIKMLRMIRFNPHISILMSSFRESRGLLLSYSVIFIIIFMAYAQFAVLMLGTSIYDYSSFPNALISELLLSLGEEIGLTNLLRVNRVLGPLFGFSFVLLSAFIFVNFFVAILNDSHAEVKHNTDKQSKEFEMADFILDRLKEFFGFGKTQHDESSSESEENRVEKENKEMHNTSFSIIAFQSHRLRRRARNFQLRNAKKLRETTRKEKKERSDQLKQKKVESNTAEESTVEGNKQHLKSTVEVINALDRLHRTCALKEIDSLTSKVAQDNVIEDIEILSLIRLLRSNRFEEEKEEKEDVEDATSETEAPLNDNEIVSYITSPNTSPALSTRASANSSRKRVSMEGLNDETVRLLKGLTATRQLPEHLTGKQVLENLRAELRKESNIIRPK
ncbi:polycystin-1-like protein 2 [Montipora capricornis]|uniref:polycystin-1-like protein 2 n=1 Tax=Montipora capricornis TaxID=246305 RepID=UPI0035F14A14